MKGLRTIGKDAPELLTETGIGDLGDELVSLDGVGIEAGADWESLLSPETYVG